MGAPAIFEKQIDIKLLHSTSTEGVTDSGSRYYTSSCRKFLSHYASYLHNISAPFCIKPT
ncbi:MAG: hypothetical protein P8X79_01205 [Reinekea sp.]